MSLSPNADRLNEKIKRANKQLNQFGYFGGEKTDNPDFTLQQKFIGARYELNNLEFLQNNTLQLSQYVSEFPANEAERNYLQGVMNSGQIPSALMFERESRPDLIHWLSSVFGDKITYPKGDNTPSFFMFNSQETERTIQLIQKPSIKEITIVNMYYELVYKALNDSIFYSETEIA